MAVQDLRVNQQIQASSIRLIDDAGNQLGIFPIHEARNKAKEIGLDLVEVSPQAKPPVVKLMDYGKFKYHQVKAQKANQVKPMETKEIRLGKGVSIAEHDLQVKINKIIEHLKNGHRVKVVQVFKGRELGLSRKVGEDHIDQVLLAVKDIATTESEIKLFGKELSMTLIPNSKNGGTNNAKATTNSQ